MACASCVDVPSARPDPHYEVRSARPNHELCHMPLNGCAVGAQTSNDSSIAFEEDNHTSVEGLFIVGDGTVVR
jgi:hypothetical protein